MTQAKSSPGRCRPPSTSWNTLGKPYLFTKGATDSTNTVSFEPTPYLAQVHIIVQGSKDLRTWQEKRHEEGDGDTEPYRSRVTKRKTQVT
jgi:hypothetical protein